MNTKLTQFITIKLSSVLVALFLAGCTSVGGSVGRINENSTHCPGCPENLQGSPWANQYWGFEPKHPQAVVNKPINMCEQRDVLYVKMHNHSSLSSAYFEDAVMVTLEDNTLFNKVVTRQPTIYLNVEPYSPKKLPDGRNWYDTDDPLDIQQIRKMYPKSRLLVLEVHLQEFAKDEPIAVALNLIDTTDGATVVYWRTTRSVWYRSMDMPIVSLIDNFNQWTEDVAEICAEQAENAMLEIEGEDIEVEIEKNAVKFAAETEPPAKNTPNTRSVLPATIIQ